MLAQREAVLRLLGDDDPETVALVREQLARRGAPHLDELRTLLSSADSASAAEQLREIIRAIEGDAANARFAQLCAGFDDRSALEPTAWELAATFLPGEDFSAQRRQLDEWGAQAAARLGEVRGKAERVDALAGFLAGELGFRGNEEEYYLFGNSLLPRVVETRLGIPISLTLLYMLVGRRAGFAIEGVGLPGHFLARHQDILFDPFHRGRSVSHAECAKLLNEQNLALLPQYLAPATPRQMLIRMLTNLRYIATHADPPLAEKIAGWEATLRGE